MMRRVRHRLPIGIVAGCVAVAACGCGGGSVSKSHSAVHRDSAQPSTPQAAGPQSSPIAGVPANAPSVAVPESVRGQLLDGAIAVLARLEDFNESAAYAQVFDRINQWSHSVGSWRDWKPDPLAASLPERFAAIVDEKSLARSVFEPPGDVLYLRDQRWLHDVAMSALKRGLSDGSNAVDDLDVAEALFRWTVRSLAIVADPPASPSSTNPGTRWFSPGELLLAGRASGAQRAWIFLELVRHAGLDGVMLATLDTAAGDASATAEPRAWIPAVVIGGEAYLFDATYGLAIPGPGGRGIATAREAASDPSVLAAMDLPGRSYPVRRETAGKLAVLVPATPESLSRRMKELESRLSGESSMRLSVDASARAALAVAALPEGAASIAQAGLWQFPFETLLARRSGRAGEIERAIAVELATTKMGLVTPGDTAGSGRREIRPLFAGKVREFRGDLDGPRGAKSAYLLARPSAAQIREIVASAPPPQAEAVQRLYAELKQDATYMLGLLMLREGQFEAADDYLGRMTLEAHPDSRWADAARVALAEAVASLGRMDEAKKLLEADESPQRFGSRLKAERLTPPSPPASGGRQR